jgi:membrane associated rhomboid family serine protease
MGIYIALPIFESEKDTINEKPFAWFGVEYNRVISNNLEPDEKKAKYQEFANKSQKDFDNKNIATFIYLERIGNSDDKTAYLEAIRQNTKYKPNETIFIGKEEPYELRNGKKLEWLLGTVIIGSILWLLMILIPKINEKELKRIKAGKPDKVAQKEMRELIDSLKPKEGYYITSIIIYLNIGIFIVMAIYNLNFISFNGTYVLNWGANFRPITTNGQWWRLLTNTFLHGGFMHLLANVYGLLFVGIFLEPLLGKTKYLLVYLTTGVLASIASIWWYEATISVGASGAIFGLYGFFLSILLKVFSPKLVKGTLINILIFIGFNLMMGFTGGVDNAAHIGGLVSGFVLGLIMSKQLKQLLEKQEKTEYD